VLSGHREVLPQPVQ